MRLIRFTIWATLAVMVDVSLARVAFGALVPSLRIDLGLNYATVGLIAGANAAGYLITSAAAPVLSVRLGLRRVAVLGHVIAAVGFALSALAPNAAALVLLRVLSGLGSGGGLVAALRLALDAAGPARRVLVSTTAWSGAGLGLILAAFAAPWLHEAFMWRAATWLGAALAFVIACTVPPQTSGDDDATVKAHASPYRWRSSGLILGAYWLFGFGYLSYSTFSAVGSLPASPFHRFLTIGLAAIVGSVLAGRMGKPERSMGLLMLFGAVAAVATVLRLPIGDALFGLGLAAIPGLATAILRSRAGATAATHAIALSTVAVSLGQAVGPLVAGSAAGRFGVAWAFFVAGGGYAVGCFLIFADQLTVGQIPRREAATRAPL